MTRSLQGNVAWVGEPRALKFDLAVDQIDLDRYLGGGKGPDAPVVEKPAHAAAQAGNGSAQAASARSCLKRRAL